MRQPRGSCRTCASDSLASMLEHIFSILILIAALSQELLVALLPRHFDFGPASTGTCARELGLRR